MAPFVVCSLPVCLALAAAMLLCAQDDRMEVRRLIDARQLAPAEAIAARHLETEPSSLDWLLVLAEIRLDQRRFRESLQLLGSARQKGAPSARARLLAGLNYVALERLDLAEPEFRAALELNPEDAPAHYYLGRLLYTKNLFDEAIENTKTAIRLDPAMVRAYDNLGLCLEARQRYAEAEQAYLEGIRRQRASGAKIEWPALNLGAMLLKQNAFARAKPYLEEALAINPKSAEAHLRLGSVLEQEGAFVAALAEYRRASALDPRLAAAHYRAGRVYRRLGRAKEAEEQFQEFGRKAATK